MDLEDEYVDVVDDDADVGEGGTAEEQPVIPKDKEEENQDKLDRVIPPTRSAQAHNTNADPEPVFYKVEVIGLENLPREQTTF